MRGRILLTVAMTFNTLLVAGALAVLSNAGSLEPLIGPAVIGQIPGHGQPVVEGHLKPLGYQQITSLSSATALTVPPGAHIAVIQAEAQSIRWRDHGGDPTPTVGMLRNPGAILEYNGELSAIRLIETAGGAIVNVSYYGI